MVPKIAPGGAGFIGAGRYYLGGGKPPRDGAATENAGGIAGYMLGEGRVSGAGSVPPYFDPVTGERLTRVGHTATRHLPTEDPKQALGLMQDRYEAYLVERAHKPGRRLKEPVYAYSLSWAPGEEPDWDEMLLAAETSLTVLGMDEHQAVIVEHCDKAYRHIHVVVNRVHPTASRAAHTSMDQFKLSRWAQAFELERGQVWCKQRVENNAQRDGGAAVKDTVSRSRAEIEAERAGAAIDIRAWRAEQDELRRQGHLDERQALWARQQGERQALEAETRAGIATAQQAIKAQHRPAWRALYRAEKQHLRHVAVRRRGILERAVHAFVHARALGMGKGLSAGEIALFALSKRALLDRIKAVHQAERAALSAQQLGEHRAAAKTAWAHHHEALKPMRLRHAAEREDLTGEIRADWTTLRQMRRRGEDQALFEALQTGAAGPGQQDAPPEPPRVPGEQEAPLRQGSASRLTQVWGLFRSRFGRSQAAQTETASDMQPSPVPQAVPDRTWLQSQTETLRRNDRHQAEETSTADTDRAATDTQRDTGMER